MVIILDKLIVLILISIDIIVYIGLGRRRSLPVLSLSLLLINELLDLIDLARRRLDQVIGSRRFFLFAIILIFNLILSGNLRCLLRLII